MEPSQILLEELKKEGLDVAEDALIGVVKALFKAMPKFFVATDNKYDDMVIALLPLIEPEIIKMLDQVDGKEG